MSKLRLIGKGPGAVTDKRFTALSEANVQCSNTSDFVREIVKLWSDAQRKFALIGRYLIQAKATLPHGEYQRMVERELPFGYAMANQLRSVAEAIEAGILPVDRMPRDCTAAYYLAKMTPDERQQAEAVGLIRQDVSRREVVEFKRQVRAASIPTPITADVLVNDNELLRLEGELAELDLRQAELDRRRAAVVARLAQLRGMTE
jgi:hypothetical protein